VAHGLGHDDEAVGQDMPLDIALFGNHGLSGRTSTAVRIVTHPLTRGEWRLEKERCLGVVLSEPRRLCPMG